MSTYDPVSTASSLAENYVYARQLNLDNNSSATQSKLTATNTLKSSLTTFSNALSTLSAKGSIVQQTTSVSNTSAATASVGSSASAGTYTFSVQQLATSQQTLYVPADLGLKAAAAEDVDAEGKAKLPAQPSVVLSVGNEGFYRVDLDGADTDGDGQLSVTEVARAINQVTEGKVTASVLTGSDGTQQLLLNAGSTGQDGAFALHTLSGLDDGDAGKQQIKDYLAAVKTNAAIAAANELAADDAKEPLVALLPGTMTGGAVSIKSNLAKAQDAIFKLGDSSSDAEPITQSSNTYTGIEGLTVNLLSATGAAFTVSVAKDPSKTTSSMQSLVTSFNTLMTSIDKLTASGSADSGVAAGALNGDAGVRSLRNQLNSLLRSTNAAGVSLQDFGISALRDGTIKLDEARFAKKLAADPAALDELLGQTATLDYQRKGVMGTLQTYVNSWTNTSGGLLQNRIDNLQKVQTQYTKEQTNIDTLYEQAYSRYLTQFTALANLESQMSSTTSLLTALFASDDD